MSQGDRPAVVLPHAACAQSLSRFVTRSGELRRCEQPVHRLGRQQDLWGDGRLNGVPLGKSPGSFGPRWASSLECSTCAGTGNAQRQRRRLRFADLDYCVPLFAVWPKLRSLGRSQSPGDQQTGSSGEVCRRSCATVQATGRCTRFGCERS